MRKVFLATFVGWAAVAALANAVFAHGPTSAQIGAAPTAQPLQLLGFANATLVSLDPQSLRPLPGAKVRVGSGGCAPRQGGTACWSSPPWTASPNGRRLAIAHNDASILRLVDAERIRVTASIPIDGGPIGALAWIAPGQVLAVQEDFGERQRLLVIDVVKRRVTLRQALGGSVQRLAVTTRELVMLLAPAQAIGLARLAVADARGALRSVRLRATVAGSKLLGTGSEHQIESHLPGLAVDANRRRAFVAGRGDVTEVDLRTLGVSSHMLERRASFRSRPSSRLGPAAPAKQARGYVRQARWLGGDRLAVSGSDVEQGLIEPAGLLVAETGGWSARSIDRAGTGFEVAGDVLLAMGGNGFAAYDFEGDKRFQLFDGQRAWLSQTYGGRAYVGISGQEALRVVDLATGSVVGTRDEALPWLLRGDGAAWWSG